MEEQICLQKNSLSWLPKDNMSKVSADNLWHIRLEVLDDSVSYVCSTSRSWEAQRRIDLFNYILYKKSNNWPYAVHPQTIEVINKLKTSVCGYCKGRPWVYPIAPGNIGVIKKLAVQLGFRVKIVCFCKHKACVGNRPPKFDPNIEGVTFINAIN